VDPVQYYLETLLPRKLPLDLQYLEERSALKNLKLFFQALWVILAGAVSRRHLLDSWTQILLLGGDAVLCLVSLSLAHLLRFERLGVGLPVFYHLLPLAVLVRLPVFLYCGFYQTLIRYLSLADLKRVMQGAAIASLVFVAAAFLGGVIQGYSRGVFLIDWLCLAFLLTGYRLLAWKYRQRQSRKTIARAPKPTS
jgi:hypothetical protein